AVTQAEAARESLGERGLAHARLVFEEQMSAGEQAAQCQPDLPVLAEHHLADFGYRLVYLCLHATAALGQELLLCKGNCPSSSSLSPYSVVTLSCFNLAASLRRASSFAR